MFRFHEHNDNTFYDVIKHCFDSEGGGEYLDEDDIVRFDDKYGRVAS